MLLRLPLLLLALLFVPACVDSNALGKSDPPGFGRLALPLESTATDSSRYRLRQALFLISNEQTNALELASSDDDPTATEIRVTLPEGDYAVEIRSGTDGFRMDRIDESGDATAAKHVELVSEPVVHVQIVEGEEAHALFRFLVDGVEVGFGDLVFAIEVNERGSSTGPSDDDGTDDDDTSDDDVADDDLGLGDAGAELDAGVRDAGVRDAGVDLDAGLADAGDAEAGAPYCGDGIVNQLFEDRDDGNDVNDDECSNDCVLACVCGDLIKCPFEDCDDGNLVDTDDCPASCLFSQEASCGDAIKNQSSEECDDGNDVNDDACANNCTLNGDGIGLDDDTADDDTGALNPECNPCWDSAFPELVAVELNQACTADPLCAAVRDCVVDSNCYVRDGSPSKCFCGETNIDDCQKAEFVPTGACADEIKAASAADGLPSDNATLVAKMAVDGTTSGQAFGIIIPSIQIGICIEECSLE